MSEASAGRWTAALEATGTGPEVMLWRLLRIGSAPYFVLGIDRRSGEPVRYRIASPWDWRDEFELLAFEVTPGTAGQPRVDWRGTDRPRRGGGGPADLAGHVEIRWSHGRFAELGRLKWHATYRARRGGGDPRRLAGHVEIRWSHGRFAQPPEAKVYLDTPMEELPGYHPLTGPAGPQLSLWPAPA